MGWNGMEWDDMIWDGRMFELWDEKDLPNVQPIDQLDPQVLGSRWRKKSKWMKRNKTSFPWLVAWEQRRGWQLRVW